MAVCHRIEHQVCNNIVYSTGTSQDWRSAMKSVVEACLSHYGYDPNKHHQGYATDAEIVNDEASDEEFNNIANDEDVDNDDDEDADDDEAADEHDEAADEHDDEEADDDDEDDHADDDNEHADDEETAEFEQRHASNYDEIDDIANAIDAALANTPTAGTHPRRHHQFRIDTPRCGSDSTQRQPPKDRRPHRVRKRRLMYTPSDF